MNYLEFLQAKMPLAKFDGYDTDPAEINHIMCKLLAKQQVHICGYHRTGGGYARIYRAGKGQNAEPLQRIPHKIVCAKYRAKKKEQQNG